MIITKYGKVVTPDMPYLRAKCTHCKTKVKLAENDYKKHGSYLYWNCPFCQKETFRKQPINLKANLEVIVIIIFLITFIIGSCVSLYYFEVYTPTAKVDYEITFKIDNKVITEVVDYYDYGNSTLFLTFKDGTEMEYKNALIVTKREISQK